MTRRILLISVGMFALTVPACLGTRSDLPPHLSGQQIRQPAKTEVVKQQPVAAPQAKAPEPYGPKSFLPANPASPPALVEQRPAEPIIRTSANIPGPLPGNVIAIPEPPQSARVDDGAKPIELKEDRPAKPQPALPNITAPPWPEINKSPDANPAGPKPFDANPNPAPKIEPLPGGPAAMLIPPHQRNAETPVKTTVKPQDLFPPIDPNSSSKKVDLPDVKPVPEVKPEPEVKPAPAPEAKLPADTPLVRAIRCFQQNKPDEAFKALSELDPANQELVASLLQPVVRLSDVRLEQLPAEEASLLMERLTIVSEMLKTKATLSIGRMCYIRGWERYGYVDTDFRGAFTAGSQVDIYVELKNFLPEPALLAGKTQYDATVRGYRLRLQGDLEIRDANNRVVHRIPPLVYDRPFQTMPQDCFQIYTIYTPKLPPGVYTMNVNITDLPTGRKTSRAIEFRVAAKG